MKKTFLTLIVGIFLFVGISGQVFASFSLGAMFSKINSEQSDMNNLREQANTRASGIGAGELSHGYEGALFAQYRIDGSSVAIQYRPAYFFQSEEGTGGTGTLEGTYKYATTGQVHHMVARFYPLESGELKLFFQAGFAWGKLETEIQEADFKVTASGHNFGYLIGLGVEFMFGPHGIFLEGGARFLYIERNIVDSTSGTPESTSVSQYANGSELEYNNKDLQTNMSGVQVAVGYIINF